MDTVKRCGLCFFTLDPSVPSCDTVVDRDTPSVCLVRGTVPSSQFSFTTAQLDDSSGRGCEACRRIRELVSLVISEQGQGPGRLSWDTRPDSLLMPRDEWGRFLKWKWDGELGMVVFELFSVLDAKVPAAEVASDAIGHDEPKNEMDDGIPDGDMEGVPDRFKQSIWENELYWAPDYKFGHPFVVVASQTGEDTSSDEAMQKIMSWIQECSSPSHKHCPEIREKVLPTRVINVRKISGPDGSSFSVRLWKTAGATGYYVCLSHCWGAPDSWPQCKTTQSNLESNLNGVPWDTLPKTFQDAIEVTYRLGYENIWIDSMCIVQDDPADWGFESLKMASIYENAVLTIAATNSKDSRGGLFHTSSPVMQTIEMPDDGRGIRLHLRAVRPHPRLWGSYTINEAFAPPSSSWPLLTRAWVYQERLLSPRVVHFTNMELIWECAHDFTCECSTPHMPGQWKFTHSPPSKVCHGELISAGSYAHFWNPGTGNFKTRWREIIEEYSPLSMTKQTDRLPAISGVAQQLAYASRGSLGNYMAGTWATTLAENLVWYSPMNLNRRQKSNISWSWACAHGVVFFPQLVVMDETHKHGFELRGYSFEPAASNPYGQLEKATITVLCSLLTTTLAQKKNEGDESEVEYQLGLPAHPEAETSTEDKDKKTRFYADYNLSESDLEPEERVYCMDMRVCGIDLSLRQWCVVLRQAKKQQQIGIKTFERIGIVSAPDELIDNNWFYGWTAEDRRLIQIC